MSQLVEVQRIKVRYRARFETRRMVLKIQIIRSQSGRPIKRTTTWHMRSTAMCQRKDGLKLTG